MSRPHIEFIEAGDVAAAPLPWGPFAGRSARMLSEDDETGAFTALVTLAAGERADLAGGSRPIELFGLRGMTALGGRPLGPGSYAYVPSDATDAELAADGDEALLLVMVEEERDDGGGAIEIIDTNERKLAEHGIDGVPPGLVIKLLRVDEERGDWTWVASAAPGWQEDRAEIHPTVEEALMLRGDILLGERGGMTAGSYFWRAPMVLHGPMYTRGGALIFFRTKGGGMDVTWQSVPGWQRMVEEYRDREPLYHG